MAGLFFDNHKSIFDSKCKGCNESIVFGFLFDLGYPQYVDTFEHNGFRTKCELYGLEEWHLPLIGVKKLGHINRIMNHLYWMFPTKKNKKSIESPNGLIEEIISAVSVNESLKCIDLMEPASNNSPLRPVCDSKIDEPRDIPEVTNIMHCEEMKCHSAYSTVDVDLKDWENSGEQCLDNGKGQEMHEVECIAEPCEYHLFGKDDKGFSFECILDPEKMEFHRGILHCSNFRQIEIVGAEFPEPDFDLYTGKLKYVRLPVGENKNLIKVKYRICVVKFW